jgi:deazaflavin-dependent oxidoreductase (nitroreductase family)
VTRRARARPAPDEVGDQLAAWGVVARIETQGRTSGRPAVAAVGFVEEPDGSLVVAAGSPDADWARNLEAEPDCTVTIEDQSRPMTAERLDGSAASRAVVALILKYGTPAERLGRGPTFRLVPTDVPGPGAPQ